MSAGHYYNVYADELLPRGHGHPLWFPDRPDHEIEIGDVGYLLEGAYIPLFNARNEKEIPPNTSVLSYPKGLEESIPGYLTGKYVLSSTLSIQDVGAKVDAGVGQVAGAEASYSFKSVRNKGAILLFDDSLKQHALPSPAFTHYMKKHIDQWFIHATQTMLRDLRKEDLILVRGWVKTNRWAVASFYNKGATHEVTLRGTTGMGPVAGGVGGALAVTEINVPSADRRDGPVVPRGGEESRDQCIFLLYYKLKYRFGLIPTVIKAAAEPQDPSGSGDDPDSLELGTESESANSYGPLDELLEYILAVSGADVAAACEDDLYSIMNNTWHDNLIEYLQIERPPVAIYNGVAMVSVEEAVRKTFLSRVHTARDGKMDLQHIQMDELDDFAGPSKTPHLSDNTLTGEESGIITGSKCFPHLSLLDNTAEGGSVNCVAVSPDDRFIGAGFEDSVSRIWDMKSGFLVHRLIAHEEPIAAVAFSPNGDLFVSGSADFKTMVWDTTTGALIRELDGHVGGVWSVAFSPDGKTLATGALDCNIVLWDASNFTQSRILSGHVAVVQCLHFSPDGSRLVSCADDIGKIWNVPESTEIATLTVHNNVVWCMAVSPDGTRVATGSEDHSCRIWHMETGDELVTIGEHTSAVWSVTFSPDGKEVLTGSYDQDMVINDSYTGERTAILQEQDTTASAAAYSPEGEFLVTGTARGNVKLWDNKTMQVIATMTDHKDKVKHVQFSDSGKEFISSSDDGTIRVWNVSDILRLSSIPTINPPLPSATGRRFSQPISRSL